jgi:hypothetical protein
VVSHHGRNECDVRLVALESLETGIDSSPARAHEIDEQREVVDARVALCEEISFEALEPADRLVEKPTDLRDVSCDRKDLGP